MYCQLADNSTESARQLTHDSGRAISLLVCKLFEQIESNQASDDRCQGKHVHHRFIAVVIDLNDADERAGSKDISPLLFIGHVTTRREYVAILDYKDVMVVEKYYLLVSLFILHTMSALTYQLTIL